jgi:hypothetical protein
MMHTQFHSIGFAGSAEKHPLTAMWDWARQEPAGGGDNLHLRYTREEAFHVAPSTFLYSDKET